MPNLPISGLTASATNAASTDLVPVVQTVGVGPVKMTLQQFAGGLLGSTSFTGATVTANAPLLDMSQTWNNAAVTFNALKLNVTDTASNASSLLMDLQVGGTSRFNVSKAGAISSAVTGASPAVLSAANFKIYSNSYFAVESGGGIAMTLERNTATGLRIGSTMPIGWASTVDAWNNAPDLFLTRRAAANLRFGAADAAAPVAQTLSVQSVVAGTTNTAGANLTITGSQGTGTGAGGSIIFQVAPAGSSGTAQNALVNALTISGAGAATFVNNVNAANIVFNSVGGGLYIPGGANFLTFDASLATTFGGLSLGNGNAKIYGDAANILALRNGANAQTFRVYNTTDGTNGEWLSVQFSSNLARIGTNSAGTGVARELLFGVGGGSQWALNTSGHLITYGSDNTYDIGTSGGSRPRNVYVAGLVYGSVETPSGGYVKFSSEGRLTSSGTDGVFRIQNNAGNDFNRLQFGGFTSSFPAIKRSSTTLQARLADDSGFASVQGKLTTDTAYAAGDPTTTGYLVVYDSTGTAYKIPAVAV